MLLCSSLVQIQSLTQVIPNMDHSYIVDVIEELFNPVTTCHVLFLSVVVHELCQVTQHCKHLCGLLGYQLVFPHPFTDLVQFISHEWTGWGREAGPLLLTGSL